MAQDDSNNDFKQFGCMLFIVTATISVIYGAVSLAKLYANSDVPATGILSLLKNNNTNATTPTPLTGLPTPLAGLTGAATYFIFGCGILMGLAVLVTAFYRNSERCKLFCRGICAGKTGQVDNDEELRRLNLNSAV